VKKFIATQYYFEGHGSLTTLTKAEAKRYRKTIKNQVVLHSAETFPEKTEGRMKETSQEKFQRLMKESESLLQQSNQLLEESK
jgi:hypothetical protein